MEKALVLPINKPCKIIQWKVKVGSGFSNGTVLCLFQPEETANVHKFKASEVGTVIEILENEGEEVYPGTSILMVKGCTHPIVMKDMCAECGADLREDFGRAGDRKSSTTSSATVAMVHSVPELIVSEEQAVELGKADEERLLKSRKLVLLVDLDETVLHTTNDNVPANLKDVYHFQLWHGHSQLWYHTKFRPNTEKFLQKISQMFELHICTFGARMYAHTMARFLDPEGKYFSHRILSRDECFDARSKTANLKALFPCGDAMVCIIDDRDEVWNFAPNMIRVKPYIFFDGTADINAPPGLDKGKGDALENNNVKPKRQVKIVKVPKKKKPVNTGEQNESTDDKLVINDKDTLTDEKVKPSSENQSEKNSNKESTDIEMEKECIEEVMDVTETLGSEEEKQKGLKSSEEPVQSKDQSGEENMLSNSSQETCAQKEEIKVTKEQSSNIEETETLKVKEKEECENNKEAVKDNKDIDSSGKGDKDNVKPTNDINKKQDNSSEDVEYEEQVEWEDDDDYLMYLEEILTRIHTAYYDMYDQIKDKKNVKKEEQPNVKKIIPYVKKKVLQGVNIVFSSVVPTNQPLERSRAYFVAKSLGAEVHTEIKQGGDGETTTHLVAAKMGTMKVKAAMKQKGIHVVRPDWLWTCNDRWEHVEEMLFLLDEAHQYKDARDSPDVSQIKEKIKRKAENDVDVEPTGNAAKRLFKKAKITTDSDSLKIDNLSEETKELNKEVDMEESKVPESSKEDVVVDNQLPSTSGRVRRFSETINPLYSFSSKDFEDMDKEVDEILSGSSSSEDEEELSNDKKKDNKNNDGEIEEDNYYNELGESKAGEKELRQKVLGHTVESSSEDSMSGDFPRGWKKKTSPKREYDDNRHLLEIDDPGEANLALLKAAQSSPHWLFEESSESQDDSDADSIGSVDEEMAAAVEKELFR